MARKKKRSGRGLGHKETQVLHLKEFLYRHCIIRLQLLIKA